MSAQVPTDASLVGAQSAKPSGGASSRRWLEHFALLALLLAAGTLRESGVGALVQAVIWLPTGVAIAGVWRLGARALVSVAIASAALRLQIGYPTEIVVTGALGACAEAWLGGWLLTRLRVDGGFARLSDVLGLIVVAMLAPIASIALSWLGRLWLDERFPVAFYSGWDGWWRMNALGVLVLVPLLSTLGRARRTLASRAQRLEAALCVAAVVATVALVMSLRKDAVVTLLLLDGALATALIAAVRLGPTGAAWIAALASLSIAFLTDEGFGPFLSLPIEERHDALQFFTLALASIPLVLGALIAEREEALRRRVSSESERRAIEQLLPDVTCRVRSDATIVAAHAPANAPAAARALQAGRSLAELASSHDAGRLRAALHKALADGAVTSLEAHLSLGGVSQPSEVRFVRAGPDEALCLVRDISARKRTEALGDWHARVLELIATGRPSSDALRTLVDGIESFIAGATASLLVLEGARLRVAIANSLPAAYNAALDGVEIGPEVGSCGTAAYHGRTVVVRDIQSDPLWRDYQFLTQPFGLRACWSVPVRSASGAVLGTFAVYFREPRAPTPEELDLLERAAALAGVAIDREQREGLLASINRNVNEGLFRSSPARGFLYVNDALVRMLGYDSAEELMAVAPPALHVDPQRHQQLIERIDESSSISSAEVPLRRRDGSTLWALVSAVAWRGADGRVEYYDGAVVDATQRRLLEAELRQAQKMEAVGRLAGGVAHDFNNLLTAIAGYAESLQLNAPSPAAVQRDAQRILDAADRAAALTRQLLAYSRQQVLSPQVHDLTSVVDGLSDMLRRLIGEHIHLTVEHAQRGAFVLVDRGQIEQVVLNLALNARDALPEGGQLTIRTELCELDEASLASHLGLTSGPHVRLSVADDGSGMDELTRQRAFDPFFTTKEQGKGTGLGLSTVYGIVHQSGGAVAIESAPGRGTLVSVWLPVAPPPAALPAPSAPAPQFAASTGGLGLVLVAEDEPMVREIVTGALRSAGYDVLEAQNGEQAFELARARLGELELLISDRIMPRLGGDALAERLQALRPDLPVLLMSGYAGGVASGDGGVSTAVLDKPFTRGELLERVSQLLRARSAVEQPFA